MRDLRLQDSPFRAGALRYATYGMALLIALSVGVACVHMSLLAWGWLRDAGSDASLLRTDNLVRFELLGLFGLTRQVSYVYMNLARSGLAIDEQVVAAALLRSTGIYTALAAPASLGWLLGKVLLGDNWWCILTSFVAYCLAGQVLKALFAFEPKQALEGRFVLTVEQASRHL